MALTYALCKADLAKILKDTGQRLGTTDLDEVIVNAAKAFSRELPLEKGKLAAGDGNFDYTLPTDFEVGFSTILKLYFPYLDTDQEPPELEHKDFELFRKASTTVLRFLKDTPAANTQYLLIYTARHSAVPSPDAFTIQEYAYDAFKFLCASLAAKSISNFFSGVNDSTLQGDVTDYEGRAAFWSERAEEWMELYKAEMAKIPKPGLVSASAMGEWDMKGSGPHEFLLRHSDIR